MTRLLKTLSLAAAAAGVMATSALAEGFERIDDKARFTRLMQAYDLRRFGVRLKVADDGQIMGSAFGQEVSGDWNWQDGFFCRDLYLGGKELDKGNCQLVEIRGSTVRFTSDKGSGDYADLRLD